MVQQRTPGTHSGLLGWTPHCGLHTTSPCCTILLVPHTLFASPLQNPHQEHIFLRPISPLHGVLPLVAFLQAAESILCKLCLWHQSLRSDPSTSGNPSLSSGDCLPLVKYLQLHFTIVNGNGAYIRYRNLIAQEDYIGQHRGSVYFNRLSIFRLSKRFKVTI